jgi:uncharacterized protein YegP (UPF0339 family)
MTVTCFEINRTPAGRFTFALRSHDGTIVLISGEYATRAAALRDLQFAQRNAMYLQQFDLRATHGGKFYFVLRAGTRRGVAMSPLFAAQDQMERALAFVRDNASAAPTVDPTAREDDERPEPALAA